jgi:parallel beta-helix repeat protein
MSKIVLRTVLFAALALLPSASWGVTNAVVGTCASGTQFSTIQSAVNAASSASTIKVCPGSYPEQVTINKSVTLNGLALGRSAVIVPPAGGFVLNGSSSNGFPFAAQILVENATVTINNVGVDANSVGQPCLAVGRWVGIGYQSSSGAVKNLAIRNGPTCADSTAILAESTTNLTIANNSIHDCVDCIDVTGAANTTITSNAVIQGVVAYFGVNLKDSPGPTTISGNTISGIETGIYAINSGSVSVTGNVITTNSSAIGIQLVGVSNHLVQSNRISDASQAIAIDDTGASGTNVVTHNTINDAACGISVGPNSIDTLSPNTFYVVEGWYCP